MKATHKGNNCENFIYLTSAGLFHGLHPLKNPVHCQSFLSCLYISITAFPQSWHMTNLQGVPPLLGILLMWQALPLSNRFYSDKNPGLLSARCAAFMHGHVDWKMSLRTIHSSTKYSQLETLWATDIKAIIFWKKLWQRSVCCRIFFVFSGVKRRLRWQAEGKMKQDIIKIDRAAWEKKQDQNSNKATVTKGC